MKRKVNTSRVGEEFTSLKRVRLAAGACSAALVFSGLVPISHGGFQAPTARAEESANAAPSPVNPETIQGSSSLDRWPLPDNAEIKESSGLIKQGLSYVAPTGDSSFRMSLYSRATVSPRMQFQYLLFDPKLAPYIKSISAKVNSQSRNRNVYPFTYKRYFEKVESDTLGHVEVGGEQNGELDPYAGKTGVWRAIYDQSSGRATGSKPETDPSHRRGLTGNWGIFNTFPVQNQQVSADIDVELTMPIEQIRKETGFDRFVVDTRLQENVEKDGQKVQIAPESPLAGAVVDFSVDENVPQEVDNSQWLAGNAIGSLTIPPNHTIMGPDKKPVKAPAGTTVLRYKQYQPTSNSYGTVAIDPKTNGFDYHIHIDPRILDAVRAPEGASEAERTVVVWNIRNGVADIQNADETPVYVPVSAFNDKGHVVVTPDPKRKGQPGYFYVEDAGRVINRNAALGVSSATHVDIPIDAKAVFANDDPTIDDVSRNRISSFVTRIKEPDKRVVFSHSGVFVSDIQKADPLNEYLEAKYPQVITVTKPGAGESATSEPNPVAFFDPSGSETETTGNTYAIDPSWEAPAGVTAQVDDKGNVTITVTDAAKENADVSVPVKVTYNDDTVDDAVAKFTVNAADSSASKYELEYPTDEVKRGDTKKLVPQLVDAEGNDVSKTGKVDNFEILYDQLPDGVTKDQVSMHNGLINKGEVTFRTRENQPLGDVTIPVRVNYKDGSAEDSAGATFTVVENPDSDIAKFDVVYPDAVDVSHGASASQTPEVKPVGRDKVKDDTVAGYTLGALPEGVDADDVVLDETTGVVTYTPSSDQKSGVVTIPVNVTYSDTGLSEPTNGASFNVLPGNVDEVDVSYPKSDVKQGDSVSVTPELSGEGAADKVESFELGTLPEGVTADDVTIDPKTGEVTFKPGSDLEPGDYTIPVKVTYKDGTSETTNAVFTVNKKDDPQPADPEDKDKYDVSYPKSDVKQGDSVSVTPELTGEGAAENIESFELGDLPEGVTADDVTIDPKTGEVTFKPGSGLEPGDYTIPVKVTYKDGTSETTNAVFTVNKKDDPQPGEGEQPGDGQSDAAKYDAAYPEPVEVQQQDTVSVTPKVTDSEGKDAPAGAVKSYKLGELPKGITKDDVEFDPATGKVTFTPTDKLIPGEYTIPVEVTYEDGTTEPTNGAKFKVTLDPEGDLDGDGIPNNQDPDVDGDGVNNDDEIAAGLDPLNPDTDGNGTPDGEEDADGDGRTNAEESNVPEGKSEDTTGDGIANPGITDENNNGVADLVDPTQEVTTPEEKVLVDDAKNLNPEEKEKVKDAVVKANPGINPDNVTVGNDGTATIKDDPTYTDTTIPGKDLVKEKDVQPGEGKQPVTPPKDKVAVNDPEKLTPEEKEKVKDAIEEANPGIDRDKVTVGDDGTVTVKDDDKYEDTTIPGKDLVTAGLSNDLDVVYPEAETAVQGGEAAVIPSIIPKDGVEVPAGAVKKFELGELPAGVSADEVQIDPASGAVVFKPGADHALGAVTIPVIVTYKDGTSEPTNGASFVVKKALNKPSEKIEVKDPKNLTDDEKKQIKDAVVEANPGIDPDKVSVDDKGNVTVKDDPTYADGTIPAEDTVNDGSDQSTGKKVTPPTDKVVVKDPKNLTDDEKEAVKQAVVDANPGIDPDKVTVGDDGTVTVKDDPTYADTTLDGKDLVSEALSSAIDVVYPDTDAVQGGEATATPKLVIKDGAKVPADAVAKFELGELPAGVDADQVSIDPKTGAVTFKPKDGQNPGDYVIPVKVTYKDGTSEDTNGVTFKVKKKTDEGSAPSMIAGWVSGSSGNGNAQGGANQGGSSAILGGSSNGSSGTADGTADNSTSSGSSNGSSGSSVNQTSSGSSNGSSIGGILAAIVGLGLLATGIGFVAQWFKHAPALPGLPALKLPQIHLFGWGDRDDRDDEHHEGR